MCHEDVCLLFEYKGSRDEETRRNRRGSQVEKTTETSVVVTIRE